MTFQEAALEILKRERRPLHFKDLTEKAMERKLLTFVGRTPEVTMQTQLTAAVKKAPGNPFVRVKPGVFGLLRYPEAAPPEPAPEKPQKGEAKSEGKADKAESKGEGKADKAESKGEGKADKAESKAAADEARTGRRRRRGGRGRRRGRAGEAGDTTAAGTEPAIDGEQQVEGGEERDAAEEPQIGSMSAEDRAAALAESGVLEGGGDESEGEETSDESPRGDASEDDEGKEETAAGEEAGSEDLRKSQGFAAPAAKSEPPVTFGPPSQGAAAQAGPTSGDASSETPNQQTRKITSPIDAAIEILKGQAPGRGLHVRQIADAAVRRRLIHGEPNEAWRVMRAALAAEGKDRLRSAQRPRVRAAGSGLYSLARRPPDSDLERAEFVLGEARRALRERTAASLEQRLGELTPAAFEAIARVLLQREGFGPATFVKRVEGTIYLEALRGRGFRPSRCLIALRPGTTAAGRRSVGELRAGIRARNQDEGLILLAGRLADDAVSEWKQAGVPVEVVDGPALAETCIRHGVGVINAVVNVDFVDADFFAEISEG
jgi:hypothetical protein